MRNLISRFAAFVVFAIAILPGVLMAQPDAPEYLRCEYLTEPTCVEAASPRLCWEVRDARRGAKQTAYEIHVAAKAETLSSDAPDAWSSGKVKSDSTCQIEYHGSALKSQTVYYWTVRTWDADDKASPWSRPGTFAMGILNPAEWKAKWIGDATPPPPPTPALNGFHTQFANLADVEKWVMIDLGEAREFDSIKLWPTKPYDVPAGVKASGFGFPVRYRVQAGADASPASLKEIADRTQADQPNPGAEPVSLSVPKTKARYVRLLATNLRVGRPGEFALALAEMQVLSGDKVISDKSVVTASDSIETGPWSTKNLTDGDTVSHNVKGWEALPAPMFRKEFAIDKDVRRATLYISALGVYRATLNGEGIGNVELSPEWTDYFTRVQYQAFDVTTQLKWGGNAIGVVLGDGWYAGRLGMAQGFTPDHRPRAVYGRQPRLIAQLRLEHEDGSIQTVVTDASWTSTLDGPIRSSDLLDGETYDSRNAIPGWNMVVTDAAKLDGTWRPVVIDDSIKIPLVAQTNEPIRQIQTIKPIAMTEPKPGVYVFDLGQNMPGWCRITVKGKFGSVITLRHAEAVNDDGTIYTTNLRGAPQVDRYIMRGRISPGRPSHILTETWEPQFTYHGFRFLELTGDIERPTLDHVVGVVFCSDPPIVSSFECSNPMLNKLWSNILWTQHANMMSVPTDCPQRDERLGWMGDILAFAQNAAFNKDMAAFYAKFSRDIRDSQADDGRFPDIAPHPYGKNERFTGVPAWGDAGVFVPWAAYTNYGDTRLIAEHFDAARRWIDWIDSKNPDHLWKNNRHNDYNDWLNGDSLIQEGWPRKGGNVPNEIFATAFFARSTWIVSEMARVLGREDDRKKYADLYLATRAAFIKNFIGEKAVMPGDTQAGYALALAFDLVPTELRADAVMNLVKGIEKYQWHLSTGFHSTHHAMIELTEAGHTDIAHRLAANTTFPSWGYSIENGATTIWERWDGYVKGRGFQDPGMNSLNHWALGSVGEWMMRTIIGINPDPASPGWSHILLAPKPGGGTGGLTHAKGHYRSIHGDIESSWKVGAGGATEYEFVIPPNTTARIRLTAKSVEKVTELGKPLAEAPGIKVVRLDPIIGTDEPAVILEVGAGGYQFTVRK